MFPHGVTLTVRDPNVTPDKYGDGTGSPTTESWGPCAIAPRTSIERADSRTPAVVVGLTVYGPPREFAATDQVVIPSGPYAGTWEVDGVPGDWSSPFTGWHPGVEVALKRAEAA